MLCVETVPWAHFVAVGGGIQLLQLAIDADDSWLGRIMPAGFPGVVIDYTLVSRS